MNKRNILTLVLMFAALATSANQRLLQLPADTAALADRLCQPRQWAPLPAAGDPYWQENLPENLRQSYIRYGERYQGKPWQSLSVTLFSEFKTQGNRVRYEAFCFAKRRNLLRVRGVSSPPLPTDYGVRSKRNGGDCLPITVRLCPGPKTKMSISSMPRLQDSWHGPPISSENNSTRLRP